jgi:hypothetical protein
LYNASNNQYASLPVGPGGEEAEDLKAAETEELESSSNVGSCNKFFHYEIL